MSANIQFDCPTCAKPTIYSSGNRFRPFCSERCKTADTAKWADESYKIQGPENFAPEGGEPEMDS